MEYVQPPIVWIVLFVSLAIICAVIVRRTMDFLREQRKFSQQNFISFVQPTTRRVRAGRPVLDDIKPMNFGKDVDQRGAVTRPMDPGKMYVTSAATVWPADPTVGLVAKAGERFGDATTKHAHN